MPNTRTTLMLDRRRLMDLKRLAAEQGRTLSSVIDEFLRLGLKDAAIARTARKPSKLPSFKMGRSRVDLANRGQLYDVMDD